jgi:hypothetical protein
MPAIGGNWPLRHRQKVIFLSFQRAAINREKQFGKIG